MKIKMKEHHFFIEDAQKYGVNEAIIMYNLRYWLDKNLTNKKNIYKHTDGKYYVWTCNSLKDFKKLFPYLSIDQIGGVFKKLKFNDVLLTGNFNSVKYDRTLWYSLKEYEVEPNKKTLDVYDISEKEEERKNVIVNNKKEQIN